MNKPNLKKLTPTESITITEFKNQLGESQAKIAARPLVVTNKYYGPVVMIPKERYMELLEFAKAAESK